MTCRLGAAFAAVVFVVTSGITAMEVHQLAAHGSQPLPAPTGPVVAVVPAPSGHGDHAPTPAHELHGHHGAHGQQQQQVPQAGDGHSSHHATDAPADRNERSEHSGHSGHDSEECTCVGPCASGAPPTLGESTFAEVHFGEPEPTRLVPAPVDVVHQDPRTYLLPFSNAPPARV